MNAKAFSSSSSKHALKNIGEFFPSLVWLWLHPPTIFPIVHPLAFIAVAYNIVALFAFTLSFSLYKVATVTDIIYKVLFKAKPMPYTFSPLACLNFHTIMGGILSPTMAQTFFKMAYKRRTIAVTLVSLAMILSLF